MRPALSALLLAAAAVAGVAASLCGGLGVLRQAPFAAATLAAGLLLVAAVAFFAVGLFVVGDARLVPQEAGRSSDVAAPPAALRLVSLNVLHGWPHFGDLAARSALLERALRALDPDVIALQEAWRVRGHGDLAGRLGRALGMHVVYARANGSLARLGFEEGCAVLSRFPIARAERLVLRPRRPWWQSRIAVVATLDLGSETATVTSAHLTNRDLAVAAAQSSDLRGRLASAGLRVVAGDFNAPSANRAVTTFVGAGWQDLVPGGIDHVLLGPDAGWSVVQAAWTLRREDVEALIGESMTLSDHPGIVVDLEREGSVTRSQPPDLRTMMSPL